MVVMVIELRKSFSKEEEFNRIKCCREIGIDVVRIMFIGYGYMEVSGVFSKGVWVDR